MTMGPKKQKNIRLKVRFEPNILSNLHLVNFDMLIEKVKKLLLGLPLVMLLKTSIKVYSILTYLLQLLIIYN